MNWYIVRNHQGKCVYAHFSLDKARDALRKHDRAVVLESYNVNYIIGWAACVIVFGGIGVMLAWRG